MVRVCCSRSLVPFPLPVLYYGMIPISTSCFVLHLPFCFLICVVLSRVFEVAVVRTDVYTAVCGY